MTLHPTSENAKTNKLSGNVLESFNSEGALPALKKSKYTESTTQENERQGVIKADVSEAKKVDIVTHFALVARAMNHSDTFARIVEAYPGVLNKINKFTNLENIIDRDLLHTLVLELSPAMDLTKEHDQALAHALSKINKTFARNAITEIRRGKNPIKAKDVFEGSLISPKKGKINDEKDAGRASAILMHGPLQLLKNNSKVVKRLVKAEKIALQSMILTALCVPSVVGTHGAVIPLLPRLSRVLSLVVNEFVDKGMKARDSDNELLKFLDTAHEKCIISEPGKESEQSMARFFESLKRNLRFLEK